MYAISYRYNEGSLMEQAMRKEKLLLNMDNDIGTKTLVMIVAAGLPEFVRNKINRKDCKSPTGLLHEIRKCENLTSNNKKKREEKRH